MSTSKKRPLSSTTDAALRHRRRFLASCAATLGATLFPLSQAAAQAASTNRILVGFSPGGGVDLVARLLADELNQHTPPLGHFIVDNKAGGAGKLAVDALRNAPANGTTLLVAPLITPVLSQLVFRNPGYDPGTDMKPVSLLGHFQFVLAVPVTHPAHDIPSFIRWLKDNPNDANFGSPSQGSLPHFFGLLLGEAAGVDFIHVPYKGGPQMVGDLIGGHINAGINTAQELLAQHEAGKVRILGAFSQQRIAQIPDIPTFAESGFPEVYGSGWYSLWTSVNTPDSTVAQINEAIAQVVQQPKVQALMHDWAVEPQASTPDALERLRVADIAKWRPILDASGFIAD